MIRTALYASAGFLLTYAPPPVPGLVLLVLGVHYLSALRGQLKEDL